MSSAFSEPKSLPRLEAAGLAWLGLALPLAFWPGLEQAYRLPQCLALALAAALLAGAWAWQPRGLRFSLLDAAALLFFAWRLASRLAQGWDAQAPAWLLEQALYLLLYIWAGQSLDSPGSGPRLRFWLLAGLGLGAGYGILQALGLDPLASSARSAGFGSRAFGSLGNPDFWAGELVLLLPLALAPYLSGEWPRVKGAALAALLLASLLLSGTRGAWLAGAASTLFLLWRMGSRLRLRRLGLLVGLGLALLLAFSLPGPQNPGGLRLAGRLASLAAPGEAAQGRAFMAGAAYQVACQHPWLGCGGGCFTGAFLAAQGPRLAADPTQPYRFTHDAHCDPLQLAAESGWPALALYLLCLGLALAGLWQRRGSTAVALSAGLLGLALHGLMHFPLSVVPSAAGFWLLLGWARCTCGGAGWALGPGRARALALAGLLLCLAAAFAFSRGMVADHAFHQGMNAMAQGQPGAALPGLQKAMGLEPGDPEHGLQLGLALNSLGRQAEAEAAFRASLARLPSSSAAWAGLGLCLAQQGRLPEALQCLRQALALDPRDLASWGNLGKALYLSGQVDEALRAYGQGLSLDPAWPEGLSALRQLKALPRAARLKRAE
jgi:tetratricopeptide (TPR) repeat protein